MRRIALPLVLLLTVLAAAPAAGAANRYALANQCWTLTTPQGAVAKAGGGYSAGAGEAERFFLKPTTLGKYMLFGRDSDYLGASGGDVTPMAAPGAETEWTIDVEGDAYTIVNRNLDRALVVAGGKLATGAAGEAARFGFASAEGCTPYPEIETSTEGEPRVNPLPWTEVRGFTDLHLHMMGFEFFGGDAHCGRPWHPYGVVAALVDCPDHYVANGELALLERAYTGRGGHDPVGWPTFKDWPHYGSVVHEQTYWRWMERSWRGGMRLFVNLLTDNEVLCEVYPFKTYGCNEMDSVRRQVRDIYELQDYIDAQYGGPGKGFFRIVTDPFEARRIINQGKLAVVLGIEVSKLFDCGEVNDVPTCDRAMIDRQLEEVWQLGVRQMEIVNKFDNGLTGVAGDSGQTGQITNTGNKYDTGHYWAMRTCTNENAEQVHDREQLALEGDGRDFLVGDILSQFLPPDTSSVTYPAPPHCNARGLTALGAYVIRRMAERKMIFDPDHMSVLARDQAMSVIESLDYSGVVSSHSWSSPDADQRIYAAGGTIAPMAGNAKSWLEEWRRLKPMRDPRFYFGMGMGADMNGFARQGPPREDAAQKPLTYPFKSLDGAVTINRQRSGERVFDFNVDGVAHYGMFPDWVQDIRTVAGDEPVEDLARAAEAYLQTWERATGIAGGRCLPAKGRFKRRGLRGVRVGAGPAGTLRRAGQPLSRKRTWRWCVNGSGDARVAAVFSRKGRAKLIASTSPAHPAQGVRAGDRARRVRARAKRSQKGVFVRRAKGGRAFVYGVRAGRVTFTAVTTRKVAKRRATLRATLRRARVR